MKILVAGSSGLIGSAFCKSAEELGWNVHRLVRNKENVSEKSVYWNPAAGDLNSSSVEGFDAVINFCGRNIADSKWNPQVKQEILDSRTRSTKLLADAIRSARDRPAVFISSSATGIYGPDANNTCDEKTVRGSGFLAEVCKRWESASRTECRVVNPRFGLVLSKEGGIIAKMLKPFSAGVGGVVGSGNQMMSWIHIDDAVRALHHCLQQEKIIGPVNICAPSPVKNFVFTKTLGRVLKRPTILPLPAFLAKLILGSEMASETLLASTNAIPSILLKSNFLFKYQSLDTAIEQLFATPNK